LEYSRELIELISDAYPFAVGAACFPETHIHATSPEADLEYLAEKVAAGADFLITQLFFDNKFYFDFLERARAAGITVPIIPGIMPITHAGQVERMADMCGSSIPEQLRSELHLREDHPEAVLDFGVAYATLQCAELLAAGAPGIHFYTLNRSPATRAILGALKLTKPWEKAVYPGSISRPSATRGEPSAAS
jgi:methylenetetrahydrofolate reductase (NADPH)